MGFTGLKCRGPGVHSFWRLQARICFFASSSSRGHLYSSAGGLFLVLRASSVTSSGLSDADPPACLPLTRTLMIILGPSGKFRIISPS